MIFGYILLVLSTILQIICLRTLWNIKKIQRQPNNEIHIVTKSIADMLFMPLLLLLFWFLGAFCLSMKETQHYGYICFAVYALSLLSSIEFLDGIIMYDDKGFSMGYPPRKIQYYLYEDISDIITSNMSFTIYIEKKKIESSLYSYKLKEFKNFIIEQHKKKEEKNEQLNDSPNEQLYNSLPIQFQATNKSSNMIIGILLLLFGIPMIGSSIFVFLPVLIASLKGVFLQVTPLIVSSIISSTLFFVLVLFIGITFVAAGWMNIALEKREIKFERTGLSVKYPFKTWTYLPWKAFEKICICYELDDPRQRKLLISDDTKICFLCVGERHNFYGFWRSRNPYHYRKVFMLPYSEEFLELVKEVCPLPIVDQRNSRIYNDGTRSELHFRK